MDALLTIQQVVELGWSAATIWRKSRAGKLEFVIGKREGNKGGPPRLIKLSSLPVEMQVKWARGNESAQAAAAPDEKSVECNDYSEPSVSSPPQDASSQIQAASSLDRLNIALRRFPLNERGAWLAELNRLSNIVQCYANINPKRIRNAQGKYEFVAEVGALCHEAACSDPVILGRESHRSVIRKLLHVIISKSYSSRHGRIGVMAYNYRCALCPNRPWNGCACGA